MSEGLKPAYPGSPLLGYETLSVDSVRLVLTEGDGALIVTYTPNDFVLSFPAFRNAFQQPLRDLDTGECGIEWFMDSVGDIVFSAVNRRQVSDLEELPKNERSNLIPVTIEVELQHRGGVEQLGHTRRFP